MPIDRLLITGAAGFLGNAIVRELIPRLESSDDPLTEIRVLDVADLFERERRLLSILPRCAHRSTEALLREVVDDPKARIGTIASIQTFGDYPSFGPRTSIPTCTH